MDHRLHKAMVLGRKKHTGELDTDAGFVWGPSELHAAPDGAPKQGASVVGGRRRGGRQCCYGNRNLWGRLLEDGHAQIEDLGKLHRNPLEILSKYEAEHGQGDTLRPGGEQLPGAERRCPFRGGHSLRRQRNSELVFNHPCNFQTILVRVYLNIYHFIVYYCILHPQLSF